MEGGKNFFQRSINKKKNQIGRDGGDVGGQHVQFEEEERVMCVHVRVWRRERGKREKKNELRSHAACGGYALKYTKYVYFGMWV